MRPQIEFDPSELGDPFGDPLANRYNYNQQKPEELGSRWEIEFQDVLQEQELKWRGYMIEQDGSLKQIKKPVMNDEGIRWLVAYIHPILTKNTYLSVYNSDEIFMMTRDHVVDILKHLFLKHGEYDLHLSDYVPLVSDCESMILSAYRRAQVVPSSGLSVTMEYRKTIIQNRILEQQSQYEKKEKGKITGWLGDIFSKRSDN